MLSQNSKDSSEIQFFQLASKHALLTKKQERQLFLQFDELMNHWIVTIAPYIALGEKPFEKLTNRQHIDIIKASSSNQEINSSNLEKTLEIVRNNYPCVQLLQKKTQALTRLDQGQVLDKLKKLKLRVETIIETLTFHNLRLIIKVAMQHNFLKLPIMDLIQEGSIGLLKAIERYEINQNTRFSTYAWWWIKQNITLHVRKQGGIVRKPENIVDQMLKLLRKYPLGDYANRSRIKEIAEEEQTESKDIEQLLQMAAPDISLEQPISADEGSDFYNLLNDDSTRPDKLLISDRKLELWLSKLPQPMNTIITLRYGLKTGETHSYREIGVVIGKSTERTRQLESEALEKLRKIIQIEQH
ncbi:sigma-70 family RNA polymerase sigma factor [Pleionea sediminis]|uniref:sigma-70 family RNA polymerase sigma factor n=1 Tax=Pleionea sediminis TaxID=2569479 RepID=UPI001186A125|nr:sigma-70 family RNA polymerase sigma factor [Pleionea sediminis]